LLDISARHAAVVGERPSPRSFVRSFMTSELQVPLLHPPQAPVRGRLSEGSTVGTPSAMSVDYALAIADSLVAGPSAEPAASTSFSRSAAGKLGPPRSEAHKRPAPSELLVDRSESEIGNKRLRPTFIDKLDRCLLCGRGVEDGGLDGMPLIGDATVPHIRKLYDIAGALPDPEGLAKLALSHNDFEFEILKGWLAKGSSAGIANLGSAIQTILENPHSTTGNLPPVAAVRPETAVRRERAPSQGPGLPKSGSWKDVAACHPCALDVLLAATYAARERISERELPGAARDRADCWYGRYCRTQRSKPAHAEKLNHICEPKKK